MTVMANSPKGVVGSMPRSTAAISPPAAWISSTTRRASATPAREEAVQARDGDAASSTGADALEGLVEPRAPQLPTRLVEVFMPRGDLDAPQLRPLLDLRPLKLRADEAVALSASDAGYPDVAVESYGLSVTSTDGVSSGQAVAMA